MPPFFTRQRFGRPQFLAGGLLLAFLAQAIFLVYAELSPPDAWGEPSFDATEQVRIAAGWGQVRGRGIAGAPYSNLPSTLPAEISQSSSYDTEHSPLLPLLTALPLLAAPQSLGSPEVLAQWLWLTRLPFLAVGVLLGASLWYVSRRLCGNTGGFIALALYCFSPSMIQASAVWHTEPEIVAAWGSFGGIFTAIAAAHTLYAPREVVLWNWRRILLLGVSFAIAIGAQFSMIVVTILALAFLLYLAPVRRGAALAIWTSAVLVGAVFLFAFYFFHLRAFSQSMVRASFWGATWRSFTVRAVYPEVAKQILRSCPPLIVLLPAAIVAYCVWPRSRYFGNTAPGLLAFLFVILGIAHPHVAGAGFLLAAVPFLLIFVSGVFADLLETRYRMLVSAWVWALLGAYILWSLLALARVPRG